MFDMLAAVRRCKGPISVAELMHFFDATHASINAPPSSSAASCSNWQQQKKPQAETEQHGTIMLNHPSAEVTMHGLVPLLPSSCNFRHNYRTHVVTLCLPRPPEDSKP